MGDHIWPALYPGIIVGVLWGLSVGGKRNVLVAAIGGALGAWLAVTGGTAVGLPEGPASTFALVLLSWLLAFAAVKALAAIEGSGLNE